MHYTRACDLDPKSPLARFEKAHALMKLRMPHEALAELEILKDMAPDEAKVHFMLGRLYKMIRQKALAIKHFTIALNLDPKVCCTVLSRMLAIFLTLGQAAPYIKDAMESLDEDDDEAYDEDDE